MDATGLLTVSLPLGSLSWEAGMLPRLLAAAALGGLIGIEREVHGRSAGLRTQLLVAMGAALAMIVSLNFGEIYGAASTPESIRVDPARVAYGVMAGIGFLGAGAIITSGAGVRGLTTAASLWCTAAIGLACGFGMYLTATAVTAITLFALQVLRLVDEALPQHLERRLTIVFGSLSDQTIEAVKSRLKMQGVQVGRITLERGLPEGQATLGLIVRTPARCDAPMLADMAAGLEGARSVRVE